MVSRGVSWPGGDEAALDLVLADRHDRDGARLLLGCLDDLFLACGQSGGEAQGDGAGHQVSKRRPWKGFHCVLALLFDARFAGVLAAANAHPPPSAL